MPLSVALPACEGHQMAIVRDDPSANQEVTVYGFNVMQVPNKPFQPRFKESIMKSLITVITVTAAQVVKQMKENADKLRAQVDKIAKTRDPAERQKLVQEHMQMLRASMTVAGGMMGGMGAGPGGGMGMGMMGGGMMMDCPMMGQMMGGGMMGEQMMQRMQQMEKRMDMMQMMLEQMRKP